MEHDIFWCIATFKKVTAMFPNVSNARQQWCLFYLRHTSPSQKCVLYDVRAMKSSVGKGLHDSNGDNDSKRPTASWPPNIRMKVYDCIQLGSGKSTCFLFWMNQLWLIEGWQKRANHVANPITVTSWNEKFMYLYLEWFRDVCTIDWKDLNIARLTSPDVFMVPHIRFLEISFGSRLGPYQHGWLHTKTY